MHAMSAYTLPTVPAICKRKFLSVKVVIVTSLTDLNIGGYSDLFTRLEYVRGHFVRQPTSSNLGKWRGALIDRLPKKVVTGRVALKFNSFRHPRYSRNLFDTAAPVPAFTSAVFLRTLVIRINNQSLL